jgi:CelD/BcsL family acetyltransferase involved in cellulose biosynthesis
LKSYPWQFEWLTSWEAVWDQSFMAQWHKWIDQSVDAYVFFEPSVVGAWVETYERLKHIEPRFLIAKGGNCTIFLPLVLVKDSWKGAWQTSLRPVGYAEFDYHDPIMVGHADPSMIKSYWESLFSEIDSRWGRSLDLVAINGLRSNFFPDKCNFVQTEFAPFINLKGFHSAEEILGGLSQSLRGDIKRQKRRLEGLGEIKLHIFSKDETEGALRDLPEILSEHSRRWPGSYKVPGFHATLIRNCLETGILHMSELLLNNSSISWHIGFLHKTRYYWYMPVYRPKYREYSPGKLHLYLCLEDAMKRGCLTFDLLKGDEEYKRQWTSISDELYDLTWRSKRFISLLRCSWVSSIKPKIHRAATVLRLR